MEKLNLIILILIGAVLFVVGGGLGIIYQNQKTAPEFEKAQALVKTLSSKPISSITAQGKVTAMDGRNISLTFEGENLTINIKDDAKVYSLKEEDAGLDPMNPIVDFNRIKIGDSLGIDLNIEPSGQISGEKVIIFPVADIKGQ